MNTLHLMVGNIGTGKSYTTKRLVDNDTSKRTLVVNTDALVLMMHLGVYTGECFTDDRRVLNGYLLQTVTDGILQHGYDVVLDTTMMSKEKRKTFIDIAQKHGAKVKVYLHKTPGGLERRMKEPHGTSPWPEVYKMFEAAYEEPSLDEGIDEIIDCTWRIR